MPSSIMRKWRALWRLPRFERAWLLPAVLLLGVSRLLMHCLSFRRIAARLGTPGGTAAQTPMLDERQEARARRIARVVRLAARQTPWESNCFPQAMVARLLLGAYRIPYALFLGLSRNDAGLTAHAWVSAGRVPVSGGESFGRFTVIASFLGATAGEMTHADGSSFAIGAHIPVSPL